ncbi:hypothetical protein [Pengzhenrongella sicca]|uniref:Uncharacterized protein n=1 Tax=Pengzhenrongella sicca TaxID=2819238 RepID=A0A8A4Z9J9_9MICO|nr:hypothetical protein [Pengzhenrongella sicca]QTE28101.1 hypothetical protein J4E96_11935 [Pengzhenrongella sicca]
MSMNPRRRVTNGEVPSKAPLRRMGEIPVLVRVRWPDATQEWQAATALRWTPTHVMVTWRDAHDLPRCDHFEWFRSEDVARQMTWASASTHRTNAAPTGQELAYLD